MGDSNVIFNKCMNENKRYAECFNMAVGRKIIVPEELYNMDKVFAGQRLNRQGTYEKRRDCIKAYGSQAVCAIIGIENQAEIHSAMVLRSFIYNAIAVMTNTDILNDVICKSRKSGGGIDMCKAFEEMFAEKVEKGIELGKTEEQKHSIQKLIITLREIGADEALIQDKVMLRYQLSSADAMEAMQIS